MKNREALLELYNMFPFHKHPLWESIIQRELTLTQVLAAEAQHYYRTRESRRLRYEAMQNARATSDSMFEAILETYMEECTDHEGPSHLQLIENLLKGGGYSSQELEDLVPTPGNIAAISLYENIASRGAACHILGAGAVEYYYADLCPEIYDVYTTYYKMTPQQAATYEVHGPMDKEHAARAFRVVDEAVSMHGWATIELSVRDAFVATSLHYDGMLQAATGTQGYWDGSS